MGGRVHKSLLNAKVNLLFYFLSLFFSFFSRKIFLDCLGADFIGLTGTLGNILGYLNLAELGVGAAISFFLYKPLQVGNQEQMNEILSVFGYLYRKIGIFILLTGMIISAFFPLIFKRADMEMGIIYFSFYSFLASSLIGYFINYRQILLSADQKNYLVSIYFQSANLVKTAMQILLAYNYRNFYLWVAIEFIFSVIACMILNWKITKEYPWLQTDMREGKILLKKYPEIIKNTKLVFVHKIKDFLLMRSDEIIIFAFVSLKMVAYYGNYVMVIAKLSLLFNSFFDGAYAGVGNLVAEGNKQKILKVFWELMAIRHFIAGFMCFALYFLLEPFICLWLGDKYILDEHILVLLLVYLYIMQSRVVVDMFNHAYGLYADTWSAWSELALNLGITVTIALQYGIVGILLGKIVSTFFMIVLWKPYYLFSQGLHLPVAVYWKGAVRYHFIFILTFIIGVYVRSFFPLNLGTNFITVILCGVVLLMIYVFVNVVLLYLFGFGTKDFIKRLKIIKR